MELAKAILWLVVLGVFALVGIELVLFIRKMWKRLTGVLQNAEDTLASANKAIQELDPAIQELQPLLAKTETTVDALSLDLLHVNEILGNVNTVTGAASKATHAVSGVVEKATDAIQGAVGKITGKEKKAAKKSLDAARAATATLDGEIDDIEEVETDEGYFTYEEKKSEKKKPSPKKTSKTK